MSAERKDCPFGLPFGRWNFTNFAAKWQPLFQYLCQPRKCMAGRSWAMPRSAAPPGEGGQCRWGSHSGLEFLRCLSTCQVNICHSVKCRRKTLIFTVHFTNTVKILAWFFNARVEGWVDVSLGSRVTRFRTNSARSWCKLSQIWLLSFTWCSGLGTKAK